LQPHLFAFASFAVAKSYQFSQIIGSQLASIIKGYLFSVRFLVNYLKRSQFKMLTMRLSEFILLDENEKQSTVLRQGVALAKRSGVDSTVFLFQLGNYYVEAYCNPVTKAIEEYRMFDNIDVLKPYLEAIPLDNLLN
jgi:hypothetical protein